MPPRPLSRRRFALSAALLPGCARPAGEVRIAIPRGAIVHLPIELAQAHGFFAQEGLRVTLSPFPGSGKVMEALLGGRVDAGAGGPENAVQATSAGRLVKAFVNQFVGSTFSLVVSPRSVGKIRRFEDLRGATIGVSSIGAQTHSVLNYVLSRRGIGPADYVAVAIGQLNTGVAAVENGKVDAAITNILFRELLRARQPQIVELLSAEALEAEMETAHYPAAILCATGQWLTSNPSTARKVARAIVRAMQSIHTWPIDGTLAATPAEMKTGNAALDRAILERYRHRFSNDGRFSEDAFDAVMRVTATSSENVRNAKIDPRLIYTNEFLGTTP